MTDPEIQAIARGFAVSLSTDDPRDAWKLFTKPAAEARERLTAAGFSIVPTSTYMNMKARDSRRSNLQAAVRA